MSLWPFFGSNICKFLSLSESLELHRDRAREVKLIITWNITYLFIVLRMFPQYRGKSFTMSMMTTFNRNSDL